MSQGFLVNDYNHYSFYTEVKMEQYFWNKQRKLSFGKLSSFHIYKKDTQENIKIILWIIATKIAELLMKFKYNAQVR